MFIAPPVANRGMSIICGTTPSLKLILRTRRPKPGRNCPTFRLNCSRYREKFRAIGYEFGSSVLNVIRCPACPKTATTDPDKAALKGGIVEILGDDEDGIAATLEDFGL